MLEVDPRTGGFKRGEDNPLDCDLLVIDEASMVDVMLMQALLRAMPDKAALLIVGDIAGGVRSAVAVADPRFRSPDGLRHVGSGCN